MTIGDLRSSTSLAEAVARLAAARNADELEMAWIDGLREHRAAEDREQILAAAGNRLAALGDLADDHLRMSWLRQVAEEPWLLDSPPRGESLSSLVSKAVREAFLQAQDDLGDLRAVLGNGKISHDYALSSPAAAARLRDLGRIVQRLRGNGLLALVNPVNTDLVCKFVSDLKSHANPVPVVPESLRVTRDHLLDWATTPEAAGDFPRLIRSLIAETEPSAELIHMPGGTGIAVPGCDGTVRCVAGNRFVPAGRSMWELSTTQSNAQHKATEDYEKRARSTPPNERGDLAYVSAICAKWTMSRDFVEEMSRREDFREVRALNVDDIEAWLECAPATTVWLRERMGEPVIGIMTLTNWWQNWLGATRIPLHCGIVLAGRDDAADNLRGLCRQKRSGIVTIGGDIARDEILAFVAAALVGSDASHAPDGGVLYVDERSELKRLQSATTTAGTGSVDIFGQGMRVVVPSAEFATDHPLGSIHQLIVPLPGSNSADIVLDHVDSDDVGELLKAAGEDSCDASELGALARMSLLTLRRRLSIKPEIRRPAWAQGQIDKTLRRSLLLNSWSQSSPGDCHIIERYIGRTQGDVAELLAGIPSNDTSPLLLTDERWHAVASADSWDLVKDQLTQDDLEDFREVALEALQDVDPLYGLDHTERLLMLHVGSGARYSKYLKQGIATTLALLGSHPPRLRGGVGPATSVADRIVAQLLRAANDNPDPRTWISAVQQLPLLAEAAPDEVTSALRRCLSDSHQFAEAMFADAESDRFGFVPDSPHVHVLFALELLAWPVDHFHASVDMLARLSVIDPGGRLSNRPAASLTSIFCPWMPQTSADGTQRLAALDALRTRYPTVAWDLMLSMLPETMNTVPVKRGPRYRTWKSGDSIVTDGEWDDTIAEVSTRLVQDTGSDPERLATTVGYIGRLSAHARAKLCETLHGLADSSAGEDLKRAVWPMLRCEIAHHHQFKDAEWALPKDELKLFDDLIDLLRPARPVDAYGWLFNGNIIDIKGIPISDYGPYTTPLAKAQLEAIEVVLAVSGLPGVLELAAGVLRPQQVGDSLARTEADHDAEMLEALTSSVEPKRIAALGYFDYRLREFSYDDFDEFLNQHRIGARVTADLLRALPNKVKPWRKVREYDTEVECEYWDRVDHSEFGNPADQAEILLIVTQLLEFRRPTPAAYLLWRQLDKIESVPRCAEVISVCLEQVAEHDRGRVRGFVAPEAYVLESLLRVVDNYREHIGITRVVEIESHYFPILRRTGEFAAPNVYRRMAIDPEYFVALVECAYKPAGSSPIFNDRPSDGERQQALDAHRLLRSWPRSEVSPGLDESGQLDEALLGEWVEQARSALRAADRADIGEQMIGHALAATQADSEGKWPSQIVCDLIERIDSDALDAGIHMALVNQRGATCRGPTQSGEQERELAASYEARARQLRMWPRVGAIFRSLADSYHSEAAWHDNTAEAHRRGLWP